MDLKIILGIIAFSILVFVIGVFIPSGKVTHKQNLPWQIEQTADGSSRVFGLTLGQSTLLEAEKRLQGAAEVSLFATGQEKEDSRHLVEAYFDKVTLGGLSARVVLEMDIPETQLQAMFQRGKRISKLGSGASKVTLSEADRLVVFNSAIASLTYLPRISLDEELIISRFGSPAERIAGGDSGTVHWLYPGKGLDIARDAENHAVFQYVPPGEFSRLRNPLIEKYNNHK